LDERSLQHERRRVVRVDGRGEAEGDPRDDARVAVAEGLEVDDEAVFLREEGESKQNEEEELSHELKRRIRASHSARGSKAVSFRRCGGASRRFRIARVMTAPRYRAVLFDLDGTLVDSYTALTEAVNHARRNEGLHDLSSGRIREFVGDGMERLLQRAFERTEIPHGAVAAFEARYDQICCQESKVLDDVDATLEQLSSLGIEMAVCTNKPTFFSKKILDFLNLSRFFRGIVGPDLAGARKPDAQHLLVTLDSVQCEPREALFVGDMPVDVRAARNSGVDVAVVATGSSTREQLVAAEPDHFLERFSDLIKIV
jgi:phosphoglycolate phosphatase